MWGHKTNGLGRDFALNLGGPPENFQEPQPWGGHNKKRESSRGGSWSKGTSSRYDSGRSHEHTERDRLRNLVPKSDSYGSKLSKGRNTKSSRPDNNNNNKGPGGVSILTSGIAGRKGTAASAKPVAPKTPTPVQPDLTRPTVPAVQPAWKVMSVRSRKGPKAVASAAPQLTPEQMAKEDLARDCSRMLLFRKVFDGFQRYKSEKRSKEELANETFHTALSRKVFNRLRDSSGVRTPEPAAAGQDQEEIAFLRNLGWAPEGENEEDDDFAPLTEAEIAAFQSHKAQNKAVKVQAVSGMGSAQDADCCSSTSSSDDDSDVPIFF